MSLADRLDSARSSQSAAEPNQTVAGPTRRARHRRGEDPFAGVKGRVHQTLLESLGAKLYDPHLTEGEIASNVRLALSEVIATEQKPLSHADRTRIAQEVSDDILGHGPLEPLLRDPDITEIMVNGPDQIYIERLGKIHAASTTFADDAHLRRTIDKIVSRVGRRIDEASPLVDARLPDGSRVNAVVAPIALDGAMLTIRKFATDPFTDADLIAFGTMSAPVRDFLHACVVGRRNIIISGGTGSGKTTTLNVVSSFLPEDERIITIEDAAELQLHQEHVLRMESRPANIEGRGAIAIRDLVKNALRMRPDRIIVGEVRDGAALDMLQAMNTGHDGSITTVHANSPRDSLSRLETMVLMAGLELPVRAIREQVASGIDLVVQQQRLKDGTRRIVAITEVVGMEGDVVTMQDLFTFDYAAGRDQSGRFLGHLVSTGLRPKFTQDLADHGVELPPHLFVRGVGP
ncbi:CpaF pilus assembly protein, ATPase CpaF [Knoellia sinensis KCTC 19936]|uniref:CpaF pilus assembly protein, ATPase CpaF n=1 Tax=Knoellia sinensis KCTC 19936 TaxID=1385520 RepID=A0A0A0J9R2_9MICO|nr:CpaF family protein [Knoellia sinensis]KGN32346.1 CpaF pilus assembly protein, ATPase CpaF [Knoellia sinensis KCTC 19936]